jgi:mannose-6-phosphate isomerase-like protein (cupin superfamily)
MDGQQATVLTDLEYSGFVRDAGSAGYRSREFYLPSRVTVLNREHELWYILEGEAEFFCEGVEHSIRVCRGEVIFLPKAKAHAVIYHSLAWRDLRIFWMGRVVAEETK